MQKGIKAETQKHRNANTQKHRNAAKKHSKVETQNWENRKRHDQHRNTQKRKHGQHGSPETQKARIRRSMARHDSMKNGIRGSAAEAVACKPARLGYGKHAILLHVILSFCSSCNLRCSLRLSRRRLLCFSFASRFLIVCCQHRKTLHFSLRPRFAARIPKPGLA